MPAPELIIHNASVYTMNDEQPRASAFAVTDGTLSAVGGSEILELADATTELIDADGATIIPGLIDAHNHHMMAGEEDLFRLQFPDTASVDDICAAVASWITGHRLEPGDWVVGGSWGSTLVPELSTAEALVKLDAASPQNPVMLIDDSHHNKWVNSAALAAGGVDVTTGDPEGGKFVRDESGNLTGLLFEAAGAPIEDVRSAAANVSIDYVAQCAARGIELMHELGITAYQDASGTLDLITALKQLDDAGKLQAWAVTSLLINDNIFGTSLVGEDLMKVGEQYRTVHHRPDYTKIWLDGIPPTKTAAFLEAYLPDDEHGHAHLGTTTMPFEDLEHWLRTANSYDLGVKVHCTGDASVRMVLDAVEHVRADNIEVDVHVSHGQFVHPDDVPRFSQLGVFAEISPALWFPGLIIEAIRTVVPGELVDHVHPNRDLLDHGAIIVCGSDWPVAESPNPWHAIYGLVTRKSPTADDSEALWPGQAITVEEAVRAYTSHSALALRLDGTTGKLTPGLSADFVVLSANPFEIPSEHLKDVVPQQTWFAGSKVYERP